MIVSKVGMAKGHSSAFSCGLSTPLHCSMLECWCGVAKVGVTLTIPAMLRAPPMAAGGVGGPMIAPLA